jgi:RNA polymerase sigma-70 factor (ECF subfamily)
MVFRTVVVLREMEGFSYEEIAEIVQVPAGTVKSRLTRGRAALKTILLNEKVHIDPTGRLVAGGAR